MAVNGRRLAVGLAGFQALDALACAIPNRFVTKDLDRLHVSAPVRKALPFIKGASAMGLIAGLKEPRLGRVTSAALLAYLGCALAVHARAHDHLVRYIPAVAVGGWVAVTGFAAY